jgi:hypothetical protein
MCSPYIRTQPRHQFNEKRYQHTVRRVSSVRLATLTARLDAAGVPIVSAGNKPVQLAPGYERAIVRDANGILLELVQRPSR